MNTEQRSGTSMELPPEAGYDISLRDLIAPLWRRLWLIGLCAVVFAGVALGFGLTRTPLYEANIMILIGQAQGDPADSLYSEVSGLQQLTQTMTEAVNTRPVAAAAIHKLDLSTSPGKLLENLKAEQVGATQFIDVSYKDPNPERAKRIANAIGDTFSRQVSEVSPSANAITATVWERATVPQSPVSPNLYRNLLLALVAGGALGVALAFLLEYLDDSWGSPEEAEQISGVPTFGVIPTFKVSKAR